MSRKRSEAAIQAYHERFVLGAQRKHGVDAETAERVFAMVKGFSGFGFPKAHGAAFGLLAYQSTWLRVHYTPELLCSLLNEQPMGFYPPDALVHEAQRRGIEVLAPDVNESGVECEVELAGAIARSRRRAAGRVRIGLGYVRGVRGDEVEELVARPRGRRALQESLGSRLARRLGRVLAGAAGLVGSVRLAGGGARSAPPRARSGSWA